MKTILLLFCCLRFGDVCAEQLILNTEESPPTNMMKNGVVTGLGTEKIKAMMQRANISYEINLMPWRRSLLMAQQNQATCVFSTTRTAERENSFKWVGPVAEGDWTFFARADRGILLKSVDDARPYLIGTYNGDVQETYLKSHKYKILTAINNSYNPANLMAGRIDLWAAGRREGLALIRQAGLSGKIIPLLSFRHTGLYLACNLQVSDETIDKLNNALKDMQKDGTAAAIDKRFQD